MDQIVFFLQKHGDQAGQQKWNPLPTNTTQRFYSGRQNIIHGSK